MRFKVSRWEKIGRKIREDIILYNVQNVTNLMGKSNVVFGFPAKNKKEIPIIAKESFLEST